LKNVRMTTCVAIDKQISTSSTTAINSSRLSATVFAVLFHIGGS
jgi:hypothetical protein